MLLMRRECLEYKLHNVNAKINACLLRYTDILRPDRAYFDAGTACKHADDYISASIYLNRFLDIYKAIDNPEAVSQIDNT